MSQSPPLPLELWEQVPPVVQAALWVLMEGYERRIRALEGEVAELKERLGRNSQNSSQPPSSDGPHGKRRPPAAPSGRRAGGQAGHPGHRRVLLPVEEVDAVVPCVPPHCRRCGGALTEAAGNPVRHQVVELPVLKVQVTEYRLARRLCVRCGLTTCGQLPGGVPRQGYGPRFASFISLCSGNCSHPGLTE